MQFRILGAMALIALLALAFAGLRHPAIGLDGLATSSLCLLLFAAARLASRRGRDRVFWAGFLAAMLAQSGALRGWLDPFVPSHDWAGPMADHFALGSAPNGSVDMNFRNTLYLMLQGTRRWLPGCSGASSSTSPTAA